MTNVILAIDGPLYGKVLEDFVVNHRWAPGTKFKLIHAIEPLQGIEAWPEARLDTKMIENEKAALDDIAARISKALTACDVETEIRHGFPKEEILAESISWPAQMIIMGSHGRQGLQRFLLGSVSLSIITNAPCSVVTIRLPNKTQELEKIKTPMLAST